MQTWRHRLLEVIRGMSKQEAKAAVMLYFVAAEGGRDRSASPAAATAARRAQAATNARSARSRFSLLTLLISRYPQNRQGFPSSWLQKYRAGCNVLSIKRPLLPTRSAKERDTAKALTRAP